MRSRLANSVSARSLLVAVALLVIMAIAPAVIHSQTASASLWPTSAGPTDPGGSDMQSVELGVKFSVDTPGVLTSIRFYKTAASTGVHVVSLWNAADGAPLTRAQVWGETASGWQTARLQPVSLTPGVLYIASYHTSGYSSTVNYFTVGLDAPPLHAPSSAASGGNGLFQYSAFPVMPTNSFAASNYWIDVVFEPSPPTPTPSPTAASTSTPTPTPASTSTQTPSPSATMTPTSPPASTATPTSTSTAVPPAVGATGTCTEVIGFSETEEWYDGGFIGNVTNPGAWQLRWANSASIDRWAQGGAFAGWSPANLVSHCAVNTSAPNYILLNVSGDYNNDPNWWASQTQAAINYIRTAYDPGVTGIYVQPVVGGPAGALCGNASSPPSSWVRATYNFEAIKSGLHQILSPVVAFGADPQVHTCSNYQDTIGHLWPLAAQTVGADIAGFYNAPPR